MTFFKFVLLVASVLAAGSCSSSPRFVGASGHKGERGKESPPARSSPAQRPAAKPTGKVLLSVEGIASYYADDFHGKQAANGEIFNMNDLVAAHRTFPFGTKVRVTNLANARSVLVRVIDRGPFIGGRIIDLSLGAAKAIDLVTSGTSRVRVDVMEWGVGTLHH